MKIALALLALAFAPPALDAQTSPSVLEALIERYSVDHRALRSYYDIPTSETRFERLDAFEAEWRERLEDVDFDTLDVDERIDWLLLAEHIAHAGRERDARREQLAELSELVGFGATIVALEEARWELEPVDAREAASVLAELTAAVEALRKRVEAAPKEVDSVDVVEPASEDDAGDALPVSDVTALRASRTVDDLRGTLERWHEHYSEFVPELDWWTRTPYAAADAALADYAKFLREDVAGLAGEDDDPLVGSPIGAAALESELRHEWLPYDAEELLAIGEAQLAWCETELQRASSELGFGDDWKAALESVKDRHQAPGEQDALVRAQAEEAIEFLDARDLVTIPELCRETWRVRMIPERDQRTFPFASYGGQAVNVAYPTAGMDHERKLMSMRGNNRHFTRIVTPHELVPGHHLQGFMSQRHARHRALFRTPFLVEGWALYWEMRLWELGWARSPEDRIGMLFWRMHRAARVIVSLAFHQDRMSPPEMIDFLVDRVGHERDGATAEVRRYVGDSYGPLYQAAYLIGGLQLHALHAELVTTGRMTERELHDAILVRNAIPIELLRASLRGVSLPRDATPMWRFAD